MRPGRKFKIAVNFSRKTLMTIIGILILILAAIIGPIPGPGGIPLTLLGLAILAREYHWAKRLQTWYINRTKEALEYIRRRR